MIKRCMACGSCESVGDDTLGISDGLCSDLCKRIYDVWAERPLIHGAYSLKEFAKQIFEERRRMKCSS